MKRIVFSAFLILVVTACAQSQNAENETVNNTEPSEQTDNGYLRKTGIDTLQTCLLYTSPSPRDATLSRMPSSA